MPAVQATRRSEMVRLSSACRRQVYRDNRTLIRLDMPAVQATRRSEMARLSSACRRQVYRDNRTLELL